VSFEPKKNYLNLEVKLSQSEEIDGLIENSCLKALEYNKSWGIYRVRLGKEDVASKAECSVSWLGSPTICVPPTEPQGRDLGRAPEALF
jgi:hypothetical protein